MYFENLAQKNVKEKRVKKLAQKLASIKWK